MPENLKTLLRRITKDFVNDADQIVDVLWVVCHSVSKKYMQDYLDEYSFRDRHRQANESMLLASMKQTAQQWYWQPY